MRLLVVEDEKDLNRLIVDRLLQEGYAVDFCYDGVSAIDYSMIVGSKFYGPFIMEGR